MSTKLNNTIKKRILTIFFSVIAILATTVTALAVLSSISNKGNTFVTGTQSIEITEDKFEISSDDLITPNEPIDKNPTVKNTGKNPCFIRASINFSDLALKDNTSFAVKDGWELKSDGYYYYSTPLNPNEEVVLFDSITVSNVDYYKCNIYIYAESIDAETENFEQDWSTFGVTF